MTTGVSERVQNAQDGTDAAHGTAGWLVVAGQECRDLWVSGRGPILLFLFSTLLSGVAYLAGTNQALNFLEQREAVNLIVQFAVAVGVLVTMVVSADGISGERERGTLEGLLVTPVSRRAIVAGKLAAALSLWFATYLVSIPYILVLGRGLGVVLAALVLSLVIGTVVALGLASIGLLISAMSNSNKTSLAGSLFLLLTLFAPTQLPSGPAQAWFFDVLLRLNPVTSALHYISAQLVHGHGWTQELSYLVSPLLTVAIAGGVLVAAGARIVRLTGGVSAG